MTQPDGELTPQEEAALIAQIDRDVGQVNIALAQLIINSSNYPTSLNPDARRTINAVLTAYEDHLLKQGAGEVDPTFWSGFYWGFISGHTARDKGFKCLAGEL